jgi:hypothetical protein
VSETSELFIGSVVGNIPVGAGNHYSGKCTTAAATVAKTVDIEGFVLRPSVRVSIMFTPANSAANPTININGTGAFTIRWNNAAVTGATIAANRYIDFIFDGTYWQMVGIVNANSDTTYSAMSVAEGTAATATTSRVVRSDYLKQIILAWAVQKNVTLSDNSILRFDNPTGDIIRTYSNGSYDKFSTEGGGYTHYDAVTNKEIFVGSDNSNGLELFDIDGISKSGVRLRTRFNNGVRKMYLVKNGANREPVDGDELVITSELEAEFNSLFDVDGKIKTEYFSDAMLGNLHYQRGFVPSTGKDTDGANIPAAATVNKGWYWIAASAGTFSGISFETGDWLVSHGTGYEKIDNTDAVASVAGKTGVVTLVKADVGLDKVDNTADSAKSVSKAATFTTARTIALKDDVVGTATSFNGSANISIPTQLAAVTQTNIDVVVEAEFGESFDVIGDISVDTKGRITGKKVTQVIMPDASNKQNRVIDCVTATAVGTAAKVVTIEDYELAAGDIFALKFTVGNTANSPTINVNGAGAKQIRLGSGQPTGAKATGAAYTASNGVNLYYYDGTYFWQFGSNDLTDADADTTSIYNVYGSHASNYMINSPTVNNDTEARYAFVGVTQAGTIEKVVSTTLEQITTEGGLTFTTSPLSLSQPIFFASASTTAWAAGSPYTGAMFARLAVGATNWKYSVGEYYDKSGDKVRNAITTDLLQTALYIEGTLSADAQYFTPLNFALTMRDTSKVYRQVGYFTVVGYFYHSDNQPTFRFINGNWVVSNTPNLINFGTCATAAGTAAKVVTMEGFHLVNYAMISVYFSTANTVTAATTLNVNGTGAKAVMYKGATNLTPTFSANSCYDFIYNGTNWILIGVNNPEFTGMTTNEGAAGTLTVAKTISPKILKEIIEAVAPTKAAFDNLFDENGKIKPQFITSP